MTTLTFPVNSIMAYVGPDTGVVGVSGFIGMPDWPGTKTYFLQTSFIGPGLRQFNIDPDGSETLQRTQAALGVSTISISSGGAACLTQDGANLHFISDFGNSCQLAKVRGSDLTLLATFGVAGGSTSPSTNSRILAMNALMGNTQGTRLVIGTEYTTQEVDSLAETFGATDNTNCGNLDTAGTTFGILVGPAALVGDAYLIGMPFANGVSAGTGSLSLYKLTGGATLTKLGSISPAQVDATWTHFFYCAGIAYDASDGNLLIGAQTNDAVATQKYILKINASSGAVMWTRAVTTLTAFAWSFTFSRVNGHYHYLDNASLVRHINTANGTQTTETVTGLTTLGPQFSDDTTNSIILYADFNAGGSPPSYVGSYMGPPGNNHNVSGWLRFWFATTPVPPAGSGRRHLGELGPVKVTI